MSDEFVPAALRARLQARGPEGVEHARRLPGWVTEKAASWQVELGYALDLPHDALVVRGRRGDAPVILKICAPGRFTNERAILSDAQGRGYPILLESDADSSALLLEALGSPLDASVLDQDDGGARLTDLLASTLLQAWSIEVTGLDAPELHPAEVLALEIERLRTMPDSVPDCAPAIERALAYAQRRIEDSDPARHVVAHGDAVLPNLRATLAPRPGAESGYVFVEPVGVRVDREYDLGVLIRDANRRLLTSDDPVVLARSWCARLADAVGADAEATWQWAYVHRVAEGLRRVHGPTPLAARAHLQAAMALITRRDR